MLNPELERNIWLEFSPHRLIAFPAVMVLLTYLVHQTGLSNEKLADLLGGIYLVFSMLWGGHKAAEAVLEEINENTWDFQRLSSMSPWSLSWGKLLGSTCFVWYGSLILLAIYAWLVSSDLPSDEIEKNILIAMLNTLICQGTALVSSLQAARAAITSRAKLRIFPHTGLGLIAGIVFATLTPSTVKLSAQIEWHGDIYPYLYFMMTLGTLFFLWLLLGIYWQMRAQLRMSCNPLPWVAFVVYTMVIIGGFDFHSIAPHLSLFFGFLTGIAMFYVMLFIEPWNGVYYRRIREKLTKGGLIGALDYLPRWILTFLIALGMGVIFMFSKLDNENFSKWMFLVGTFACFALRDAGILHYFRLAPKNRRSDAITIFYLFVLYSLIPWLLGVMHLTMLRRVFWPIQNLIEDTSGDLMFSLLMSGLQVIIIWGMVGRRWRQHWQVIKLG